MENLTQLFIDNFTTNFNIVVILSINIFTYILVKIYNDIFKKQSSTWIKRLIFVIAVIITVLIYYYIGKVPIMILINSAIISPVAWSWLIKPIFNKLGIDYKQIETEIKTK